MLFMNRYEIEEQLHRHGNHPVVGWAVRFLSAFQHEVDEHSDGWPYWSLPVKAAAQLMTLIQDHDKAVRRSYPPTPEVTEDQLRKAIGPIKAFYTRRGNAAGMRFPGELLEAPKPPTPPPPPVMAKPARTRVAPSQLSLF